MALSLAHAIRPNPRNTPHSTTEPLTGSASLKTSYRARKRFRCWRLTYLVKFSSLICVVSGHWSKIRATAAADSISSSVRSGFLSSMVLLPDPVGAEPADAPAGRPRAPCRSAEVRAFGDTNRRQVALAGEVPVGPLTVTVGLQNGKQREAGQSASPFTIRSPDVSNLQILGMHEREAEIPGRYH